ncbi:hypothetical protein FB451DRAFT_1121933 [Mycena latifolia]|nr:hypothetical protein FB451DRAFT_1121933 [Mycena latifolia]
MALQEISDETRRLHLRSRLSRVNSLIAALTTERQSLVTQSDLIPYPILSLPPEITAEIFQQCIPVDSLPPSAANAPLLVAQICRQWRQIALDAPDLWQAAVFDGDSPIELLKLWLLRAGNRPLNCSFRSENASRAGVMIEIALLHAHHWQDVSFGLPLTSFPQLSLHHQPLPMLRSLSLIFENETGMRWLQRPSSSKMRPCFARCTFTPSLTSNSISPGTS